MLAFMREVLAPAVGVTCVLAVVAYALMRTRFLEGIPGKRETEVRNRLVLIFPFAVFSLYGELNAMFLEGGYAAIDHAGQIAGGLLAGPVVGIGAGLLLAASRYAFGDYLALPAALNCMLVGLCAGLYHEWFREWRPERRLRARDATMFTLAVEGAGLAFMGFFIPDLDWSGKLLLEGVAPMALGNALAVGILIAVFNAVLAERAVLAAKSLTEQELRQARHVQTYFMPRTWPLFPVRKRFLRLFGGSEPVRRNPQIFLDHFVLDEHRICVALGEVQSSDLPGLLLLAAARDLLRVTAETGAEPAECLYRLNNELCRGNASGVPVTLFCGVLDVRTGEMTYANAGHHQPLLCENGRVAVLEKTVGLPLGTMEERPYSQDMVTIGENELLILYTGGLTGTLNLRGESFGEARLKELAGRSGMEDPSEAIRRIAAEVQNFSADPESAEEFLLLALACAAEP